jgi:hypothetical protein
MNHGTRKHLLRTFFVLLLLIVGTAQAQSQGTDQERKKTGMEFLEGNWRQFVSGRIWECSHYRFQITGDEIEVIGVIDKIDGFCRANGASGFSVGEEKPYAKLKLDGRRLVGRMFDGKPSEWELTGNINEIKWKNPDEQFAKFMPYYIYRKSQ